MLMRIVPAIRVIDQLSLFELISMDPEHLTDDAKLLSLVVWGGGGMEFCSENEMQSQMPPKWLQQISLSVQQTCKTYFV